MRTVSRLLLCVLCLAPSLAAQSWPVDSTRLGAWAQDSTGQVWGIGSMMSSELYRWEGDKWNPFAAQGVSSPYAPSALASGPDGAVYCLWSSGDEEHVVTWQKGSASKVLAHFTGEINRFSPSIFVDPKMNVWITEAGIHIYRITPEGKAECVYTIEFDRQPYSNLPAPRG
jgi:streptogramin lyase